MDVLSDTTPRRPPASRRLAVIGGIAALAALAGCGPAVSSAERSPESVPAADLPSPMTMSDMGGTGAMPAGPVLPTPNTDATPHPQGPTPVLTGTPDASGAVDITLDVEERTIEIAPGVTYPAWTFGGHVPGPILRVKQGRRVHFTLVNHGTMPHSIDFHAAEVPPDQDYRSINPGQSLSFDFTPQHAGVFMYHCGSPMAIEHMANGMYGTIIVDPPTPLPPAREYVLVQSEWYGGPGAIAEMNNGQAQYVTFNGYWNHYKLAPLTARPGELVRFYVVNAGPNHWSAFHVVGSMFSTVMDSGSAQAAVHWIQTGSVAPGDAQIFELSIPNPGSYAIVSHSFGDVGKGDVGVLKVSADAPAQTQLAP